MALDSTQIDQLIAYLSDLRRMIADMEGCVEDEVRLIQGRNLADFAKLVEHKTVIAASIESLISNLQQELKGFNVTGSTGSLSEIRKILDPNTEVEQERELSLLIDHVLQDYQYAQRSIKRNLRIVQQFSRFHQESFRFWRSMAIEAEALYGASGRKSQGQHSSALVVRT